jgi:hypothetical protein
VNFAAITLCVASQRVFIFVIIVVVYCFFDSVRKLLDIPSYSSLGSHVEKDSASLTRCSVCGTDCYGVGSCLGFFHLKGYFREFLTSVLCF